MADDKFILMGLDDERAEYIAEVLKNKTCKKILDFLAESKEASEKDIAKALGIPINTAEYNLEKLVKSGLVEKAKNFFWSVKGKKISMYKLARKHIIISPNKNPSLSYVKSILPAILIALAIIALVLLFYPKGSIIDETKIKQFTSQAELEKFLKENSQVSRGYYADMTGVAKGTAVPTAAGAMAEESAQAEEFSTTNIQVEGVDEADIVKNDGKYIYAVSGKKVIIVEAYPAENMEILSEIDLNDSVNEIFVNDEKLIIFAQGYWNSVVPLMTEEKCAGYRCGGYSEHSLVYIYNLEDKENPELESEISVEGNYFDSRMINDYIYVVSTKYAQADNPEPPVYIANGVENKVSASEVYYWPYPDESFIFTSIMAINIKNGETNSKVFLTGSTSTIYVSQDNIYLTYQKRVDYADYVEDIAEQVYLPLLPNDYDEKIDDVLKSSKDKWEKLQEMQEVVNEYAESLKGKEMEDFSKNLMEKLKDFNKNLEKKLEKTIIHKINVDKDEIGYIGKGEVPGYILNQFSMDEHKGNFRIATTTGNVWGWGFEGERSSNLNHLYILDDNLKIIGSVEDLAPGEKIYSVRFLGDRAYVVTFKKIDPLFVIDVSKPENPKVLGYLKITGYSDYLHIYDENHIIGLGKETRGGNEQFSWYQGLKISLFDVSDVANPIEKAKIEIGDRGTDSPALYEHKAFLFDKKRNLLVIPINLAEIDESRYAEQYGEVPDYAYGEHIWQGAYVLDISLDGIKEKGRISHQENFTENEWGYVDIDYNKQIQRSLFMDDVLYTVSNAKVKANNLQNIEEISSVDLGYEKEVYPLYETAVSSK